MRIPDEKIRAFYMEECVKSAWSVRQLERQINTMYYQRILSSRDKEAVAGEIQKLEPKPTPQSRPGLYPQRHQALPTS